MTGPTRSGSANATTAAGALVVMAGIIDGFVLLPTFEAGGGSPGAAVVSWLAVNLAPAAVGFGLWRHEGADTRTAFVRSLVTLAVTAVAVVVALFIHVASGDSN